MQRTPFWRRITVACHLFALLAPLSWLYFAYSAGTSFCWASFTGADLRICLALSLLPSLLFFLSLALQHHHQQEVWGSLLACLLFLLAAAGWLYTLCDSWSLWNAARAAQLLTAGQLRALQAAALTGAISALLPPLSQIPSVTRHR